MLDRFFNKLVVKNTTEVILLILILVTVIVISNIVNRKIDQVYAKTELIRSVETFPKGLKNKRCIYEYDREVLIEFQKECLKREGVVL